MCIHCEHEIVASEDIVCYKQLWRNELFGFLYSPIMKHRVSRRVLSGKRLYRARGFEEVETLEDGTFWVDGGFVYSYARCGSVIDDGWDNVAYECVIPAGTRYFVSVDGSSYASKCLRFVKRVYQVTKI